MTKTKKMIRKPLIGILPNIEMIEKEPFQGHERSSLNQNYILSIIKAGGIPVLLPVIEDKFIIKSQMDLIDGLMLTGGADVDPLLYGEEPHPDLGYINQKRDRFESDAVLIAYKQMKPILGICRGIQIINVAFGGTLYQDLSLFDSKNKVKHSQNAEMHTATHTVDLIPSTSLYEMFGKLKIETNTFHHQAVKDLAPGFIINAKAKDGVVEGIEKLDYPFLVGVQWHPERMTDHDHSMLELFKEFVKAAT